MTLPRITASTIFVLNASGQINITGNVSAGGSITITGQGIDVGSTATIVSTGGGVTLQASGNVTQETGSLIQAAGAVTLTADFGNTTGSGGDPDLTVNGLVKGTSLSASVTSNLDHVSFGSWPVIPTAVAGASLSFLDVAGTSSADTFVVNNSEVIRNGVPITYTGIGTLEIDGSGGTNTFTIDAGTLARVQINTAGDAGDQITINQTGTGADTLLNHDITDVPGYVGELTGKTLWVQYGGNVASLTYNGGAGNDQFYIQATSVPTTLNLGNGNNAVFLGSVPPSSTSLASNETVPSNELNQLAWITRRSR